MPRRINRKTAVSQSESSVRKTKKTDWTRQSAFLKKQKARTIKASTIKKDSQADWSGIELENEETKTQKNIRKK
jgi:hypothetical protein